MTAFIALLRAVNVGGTGALPMAELRALCESAGFAGARTYIQSGNVCFSSPLTEAEVKRALESALAAKMGAPVGVLVRTADELRAALAANPFAGEKPNLTYAIFYDEALPPDALAGVATPGGERLALGARELYVTYPEGMGRSKLKIPRAKLGTARNMNTVAKLVELSGA